MTNDQINVKLAGQGALRALVAEVEMLRARAKRDDEALDNANRLLEKATAHISDMGAKIQLLEEALQDKSAEVTRLESAVGTVQSCGMSCLCSRVMNAELGIRHE